MKTPRCAVCMRPVERWSSDVDLLRDEHIFVAYCHGDSEETRISRLEMVAFDVSLVGECFKRPALPVEGPRVITLHVTRTKLRQIERSVARLRREVRWYARGCARRGAHKPLASLVAIQIEMDAVGHRGRLISGTYDTTAVRKHRYVLRARRSA